MNAIYQNLIQLKSNEGQQNNKLLRSPKKLEISNLKLTRGDADQPN